MDRFSYVIGESNCMLFSDVGESFVEQVVLWDSKRRTFTFALSFTIVRRTKQKR